MTVLGSRAWSMGTPLDPRSPQARAIADLFSDTLIVCAVIFAIVTVMITLAILRFRDRSAAPSHGAPEAGAVKDPGPPQIEGNTRLEIGWTIAPVLVLIGIFALTVRAMNGSDPPADRAPDITIIGHQWWWEVRYKSGVVTANEIHIPAGKALVVAVESADVIHDFWVPDLARKIDAIPGRTSTIWLEADAPGNYVGACAEYCGVQHAWMRILVIADTPENYANWETRNLAPSPAPAAPAVPKSSATLALALVPASPAGASAAGSSSATSATSAPSPVAGAALATGDASQGAQLFNHMTCVECHAINGNGSAQTVTNVDSGVNNVVGAKAGPDLTHLASRATLGAGVMRNSPTELARWLKDPQAVKEGCHMPNVQLSDSQIADFVSYLETLQ